MSSDTFITLLFTALLVPLLAHDELDVLDRFTPQHPDLESPRFERLRRQPMTSLQRWQTQHMNLNPPLSWESDDPSTEGDISDDFQDGFQKYRGQTLLYRLWNRIVHLFTPCCETDSDLDPIPTMPSRNRKTSWNSISEPVSTTTLYPTTQPSLSTPTKCTTRSPLSQGYWGEENAAVPVRDDTVQLPPSHRALSRNASVLLLDPFAPIEVDFSEDAEQEVSEEEEEEDEDYEGEGGDGDNHEPPSHRLRGSKSGVSAPPPPSWLGYTLRRFLHWLRDFPRRFHAFAMGRRSMPEDHYRERPGTSFLDSMGSWCTRQPVGKPHKKKGRRKQQKEREQNKKKEKNEKSGDSSPFQGYNPWYENTTESDSSSSCSYSSSSLHNAAAELHSKSGTPPHRPLPHEVAMATKHPRQCALHVALCPKSDPATKIPFSTKQQDGLWDALTGAAQVPRVVVPGESFECSRFHPRTNPGRRLVLRGGHKKRFPGHPIFLSEIPVLRDWWDGLEEMNPCAMTRVAESPERKREAGGCDKKEALEGKSDSGGRDTEVSFSAVSSSSGAASSSEANLSSGEVSVEVSSSGASSSLSSSSTTPRKAFCSPLSPSYRRHHTNLYGKHTTGICTLDIPATLQKKLDRHVRRQIAIQGQITPFEAWLPGEETSKAGKGDKKGEKESEGQEETTGYSSSSSSPLPYYRPVRAEIFERGYLWGKGESVSNGDRTGTSRYYFLVCPCVYEPVVGLMRGEM